ncbi:calcium and integrin-binding protein 1-like isoform X2 [Bacillus rossius redtenbacheri]|uniref:calcium and integrin-binding protein 1-like isoform X2 n=1 Tax=Bacillus rossius redtenbacheri TaxID=93214 RepID=UPI002FDEE957
MLRRWGRTPRLSRRNCWTSTLSSPTCTGSRYCCESGDPPYVSHVLWNCSSSFPGWTQGSGGKHALTARLSPIAARIYKRFRSIDPDGVRASLQYRINAGDILAEFRELKCNPYADRLVRVFSSLGDHHLSFEDLLDLFSALSERCPAAVKARWLFKVLDFDEDNQLGEQDVMAMLERLCADKGRSTGAWSRHSEDHRGLAEDDKRHIAQKVIAEMDLGRTGSITAHELVHAVLKMPDFSRAFTVRP